MALTPHPDDNRHKKSCGPRTDAEDMASKLASQDPPGINAKATTTPEDSERNDSNGSHFRLLNLPSELLLQTTLQLCGTEAVFNLSLVNKYLHSVAQEAMGKKLVIPTNRILEALRLLTRHPELIPKVNILDLGEYQPPHDDRCLCLRDAEFDEHATSILRTAITSNTQETVKWDQLILMKQYPGRVWPATHLFPLDVLVSLCPNIKEVTIELPRKSNFDKSPARPTTLFPTPRFPMINSEHMPVIPFEGLTRTLLLSKLEALTIPEVSRWKGQPQYEILNIPDDFKWRDTGKHIITLPGFTRLKYLDVPMDVLGLPHSIVFQDDEEITTIDVKIMMSYERGAQITEAEADDTMQSDKSFKMLLPAKTLPLSLSRLRLRCCTGRTFAFLDVVHRIPADRLKLKHIDLFFKFCPRSSILQCYLSDRGMLDYLNLLIELECMGVNITFHFGPNEKVVDIRKELMRLYFLSPAEAGLVSLLGKQFSGLDQHALTRRWLQIEARQLFVKHALVHFDLLNSPTFDAKLWSNVGFFHGPTTKRTHGSQYQSVKADNKTKLEPKRRHKVLLGKYFAACSRFYPKPIHQS
jgi:hypothetical protein